MSKTVDERNYVNDEDYMDLLEERMELISERIGLIYESTNVDNEYNRFFHEMAGFFKDIFTLIGERKSGRLSNEAAKQWHDKLYHPLFKENYESSFLNPKYAVEKLDKEGTLLSAIYADCIGIIPYVYAGEIEQAVVFAEFFVCLHEIFAVSRGDASIEFAIEEMKASYHDYTDIFSKNSILDILVGNPYTMDVLMNSDLSDAGYLYQYGLMVGPNEIAAHDFLEKLSDDEITSMAETYVKGYIRGFEITGRDITKKETVGIHYCLGFERLMRRSVEVFKEHNLKALSAFVPQFSFMRRGVNRNVFTTGSNRQFYYDHREDKAFYYDKAFAERVKEVTKDTFEKYREEAALYSGPALVEIFGDEKFDPVDKKEVKLLNDEQRKLIVEYTATNSQIMEEYIPEDETSFTIISYPVASISDKFEEIFHETVKLNTLDNDKYIRIQDKLIDALDSGEQVHITGRGDNETDITVSLHHLSDPAKQTNFENCVGDVNIPVGEVFTSPVLKGTNGLLHVNRVFLSGFEYRDLRLKFKDGMIESITCKNFEDEESNKRYLDEHILHHHDTLPMGEFAIGTNTVAYVMARKYNIEDKMDILIAEKTGPHFAVGDTCYSHAEDIPMFNPNHKEVIARENEVSALRKTDMRKAYFQCHTDITIPYGELGSIDVVKEDGSLLTIIKEGRFVLPGTEELNEPLDNE